MFLRAFIVGYVACILTIAAVGILAKVLAQDYAVATITSYHFDRSKNYNENNKGLGIERRLSPDWSISTGYYRNSYDRDTLYVFAGYTPIRYRSWRLGVVVGGVTGYENGVSPWVTGVATRDFGRLGINIVMAPSAVALQVKWRID